MIERIFRKALVVGILILFIGLSVLTIVSSKNISNSDMDNHPPDAPKITGPWRVPPGTHEWTFKAVDPDGDNVSYEIRWGDDTSEKWIGPYASGEKVTRSHTYHAYGTVQIEARANDTHGALSNWSYMAVEISKGTQQSSSILNSQNIMSITPSTGNMLFFDDTNPPVTTIYFDPEIPTGLNGWYVTPVTVTLVATDDKSGYGNVNTTYYSINSEPWEIYDKPFTLTEDNLYNIVYFSIDNAGNMEFPKLAHIKIDQTTPYVNLTVKITGDDPLQGWDVVITATAFDYTSGMEQVEFYLNDVLQETVIGSGPIYQCIFKYSTWIRVIRATAYDQAGNRASAEVTDPEIINERLINHFPLLRLILQHIFIR